MTTTEQHTVRESTLASAPVLETSLDTTDYTVTSMRLRGSIGGVFGAVAAGYFVVVALTITNRGPRPTTFSWDEVAFVAADGTTYDVDGEVWELDERTLVEQELVSGQSTSGHLLFDVPEAQVAGGSLRVADLTTGRLDELILS